MSLVFADTYYLIGLVNRADEAHERCREFSRKFAGRLLTTDYVLLEFADAMSALKHRGPAARFIARLKDSGVDTVIPASDAFFRRGLALFESRPDKDWSLTDCLSFVVMRDMGLTEALTGDHHFEQAGLVALLKP